MYQALRLRNSNSACHRFAERRRTIVESQILILNQPARSTASMGHAQQPSELALLNSGEIWESKMTGQYKIMGRIHKARDA